MGNTKYVNLLIRYPEDQYNLLNSELLKTFPHVMREWGLDAIRHGVILPDDILILEVINNDK